MNSKSEVIQVAAQLLAGMLANPHIYTNVSDEMVRGRQEQELIIVATEMAQNLIETINRSD